jgi:uncharacterized membrane protein HdeD (DUF308 family)
MAASASSEVISPPLNTPLLRLYSARFAFAVVWAGLLIPNSKHMGSLLTVLLIIYPLVDAAAVLSQLQSDKLSQGSRVAQWINVAVSVAVAGTLGWASTVSIARALAVWGVWAAAAGLAQLVTAVSRRLSGGQVPQIMSGAISVVAGIGFLAQSSKSPTSLAAAGGYAILGGIFFLSSAIRLRALLRRSS